MPRTHEHSVSFSAPLRRSVVAEPLDALPPLPRLASPAPAPGLSADVQEKADLRAFETVLASLQTAAAQCETRLESLLGEMRQAAVELAIAVAGRLLMDKVEAGAFPLEPLVRRVVERLPARATVVVHMHPEDLTLLQTRLGDRVLLLGGPDIQFHGDSALTRGGCRAVAGGVSILSDLNHQLANLRENLLENIA